MPLFPRCSFALRVPQGRVVTGTPLRPVLVASAPAPIARAERILCHFKSEAWGSFGSDPIRRELLFETSFEVSLPGGLPASTHSFPFPLELPSWLPPAFEGKDGGVQHDLVARLDVDWAVDPSANLTPEIFMAPRSGVRSPLFMRSPQRFHEEIVLDLELASTVITEDEPLEGVLTLRAGARATLDAIDLAIRSRYTATMEGQSVSSQAAVASLSIPIEELRDGDPVPFAFSSERLLPSFKSRCIEHDALFVVSADIPHARDPSFTVRLEILPSGSKIAPSAGPRPVGKSPLRHLAADTAAQAGLREADSPSLVEGSEGAVRLRLVDMARGAKLAVQAELTYPDLELGITSFRPLRPYERCRPSPLLSPSLAARFTVSIADGDRADIPEAALSAFFPHRARRSGRRRRRSALGSPFRCRLQDPERRPGGARRHRTPSARASAGNRDGDHRAAVRGPRRGAPRGKRPPKITAPSSSRRARRSTASSSAPAR